MPRKSSKQPKDYLLVYFILVFFILFLFTNYKPLLLLIAFEAAELFKISLKKKIGDIPIGLGFIFGITGAYYYNPFIGVAIFFLAVFNREYLGMIKQRHISKWIRHFILFVVVNFMNHIPFMTLAMLALILNYVLKYLYYIVVIDIDGFGKTVYHLCNFVCSTIIFYVIYAIFEYWAYLP